MQCRRAKTEVDSRPNHLCFAHLELNVFLSSLNERVLQPELMDDPQLDRSEHEQALRGLRRVHVVSGTEPRIWRAIQNVVRSKPHANLSSKLSVMDVGCGDGSLLRQLWKRAKKAGIELEIIGVDFSAQALDMARTLCSTNNVPAEFIQADVLCGPLPRQADVVVSTLFLHHFELEQVTQILNSIAKSAKQSLIIEDLLRSQFGYILCWAGVHVLSRSRIVHVDGLLSVRAAFTPQELQKSLQEAGLADATVRKCWPERALIEWDAQTQEQRNA